MSSRRIAGFSLIELLVVISIITLLIGILLPALAAARRTARQTLAQTNARGIVTGMQTFAQDNRDYYPGRSNRGAILDSTEVEARCRVLNRNLASGFLAGTDTASVPARRMVILLAGRFVDPGSVISPEEPDTMTPWSEATPDLTTTGFSYAMLRIGNADTTTARWNHDEVVAEWRATQNGQAVVLSDRNIGTAAAPASLWGSEWRGVVVRNDGSASFSTTHVLATRYGDGAAVVSTDPATLGDPADHLFVDSEPDSAGQNDTNAAMVFNDATSYENH